MAVHVVFSSLMIVTIMVCNLGWVFSGKCMSEDITISQGVESSKGIPQFVVEIANMCASMSLCDPSHIHLSCGDFASVSLVDPRIFKRLSYDNCLVNEGKPLKSNQIIRFTYSNSFMYPMELKFAKFC